MSYGGVQCRCCEKQAPYRRNKQCHKTLRIGHLGVDHSASAHWFTPWQLSVSARLRPVARGLGASHPTLRTRGRRHPSEDGVRHGRVTPEQRRGGFEVVVVLAAIAELFEPPQGRIGHCG